MFQYNPTSYGHSETELQMALQIRHLCSINCEKFLTCVSVRCSDDENSALSATLRYCLSINFFSSASNCCVVNGVLGFRLGLCFRRLHFNLAGSPFSATPETSPFNAHFIFQSSPKEENPSKSGRSVRFTAIFFSLFFGNSTRPDFLPRPQIPAGAHFFPARESAFFSQGYGGGGGGNL